MIWIRFLSSWIVLFHGLMMTPAISGTVRADANNLSIFARKVDFTLPPPFNSSSKLVNAAHHAFPSAVFIAYTRI